MLRRVKLATVSAATALSLLMAPMVNAETAQQREERCAAQTVIVSQAVEHRLKKRSEKRAGKLVRRADEIKDGPYEGQVDVLVNWVYTLPAAQLGDEVSASFVAACSQYEG